MPTLHKILESDKQRIIRFCYAEDPDLISIYKNGVGNDLDSCVTAALNSIDIPGAIFYKVETETGATVGYFCQAPNTGNLWTLLGFVIRKAFRTQQYLTLFNNLIRSTFENNLTQSISDTNFLPPNSLTNNYTVVNPFFYYNKSLVLLKANAAP
jgi:hypothetical protein